jgi:hypothetical protein
MKYENCKWVSKHGNSMNFSFIVNIWENGELFFCKFYPPVYINDENNKLNCSSPLTTADNFCSKFEKK